MKQSKKQTTIFVNKNGMVKEILCFKTNYKISFTLDLSEALLLPLRDKEDDRFELSRNILLVLVNQFGQENIALFDVGNED